MDGSDPALLALHGVRVLGSPSASVVAEFYRLPCVDVEDHLLDAEAIGLVRRFQFEAETVWSLTERGKADNELRLAGELDAAGTRPAVEDAHRGFLPLNARLTTACTNWQLRPARWDALAPNDHTDWRWDERVLDELGAIARRLSPIAESLTDALPRFAVHGPRFAEAVGKVQRGEREWIDGNDRASCHLVWIQLHEDLLATLGIDRGADG